MGKVKNIAAQIFGKLTVIKRVENDKYGNARWECLCSCGNKIIVNGSCLRQGHTKSCGCLRKDNTKKKELKNLVGKIFGRLTVLCYVKRDKYGVPLWECSCICNNLVLVREGSLLSGHTKSCGCLHKDRVSEALTINLTGKKFGRLTVLEQLHKNNKVHWHCKCSCGNFCDVAAQHLKNGHTQSCGCLKIENAKKAVSNKLKLPYTEAAFNSLYASYRINAARRGKVFELTKKEFKNFTQQNCYYCNTAPYAVTTSYAIRNGYYVYNGLDRVDNTKGYTLDNVVPCCKICNRAKKDLTLKEFKQWLLSIIVNKKGIKKL